MRSTWIRALLLAPAPLPLRLGWRARDQSDPSRRNGLVLGRFRGVPGPDHSGGSYRLTSNLIVPDESTDGILDSANDVGLDLNDFAIMGSVIHAGAPSLRRSERAACSGASVRAQGKYSCDAEQGGEGP